MKAVELREKSNEELQDLLNSFDEELFNIRFQKVVSSVPNPKRHDILRKDIARIKTILRERELSKE